MANLSSLVPITTAATTLSNLILVSPQTTVGYQPQNPSSNDGQTHQQPPAFVFDIEGENMVKLQSDITDHFVEDNTAIQDQWALRPEIISTEGFIAEINNVPPPGLKTVKAIADKLVVIDAYTPVLSTTALIAYNTAFQTYQVAQNAARAAVASWSSIRNAVTGSAEDGESVINANGLQKQPNQTRQQQAFQTFYGYWKSRTLFTVQTPWAIFQNMAILGMDTVQDEKTKMFSTFKVTFKMIRTARTIVIPKVTQGRLNSQSAGATDIGTTQPVKSIDLSNGLTSYSGVLS
jgi:hypothetical protein